MNQQDLNNKLTKAIHTTMLVAKAAATNPKVADISVTLKTDDGDIETNLAYISQVVYNLWVELSDDE